MGLGEAALASRGRRHRQSAHFGEPAQLVIGLRDADAVAGDQDRLLRSQQSRRGHLDLPGLGWRGRGGEVVPGRV